MVPIDELKRGPLLRVSGDDYEHARLLAGTPTELPPILVHRGSMAVIDGMHRVLAAKLSGQTRIAVSFFEGGEAEAFVAAVRANIEHGKPLSLADREQAAERIMALHPEWSDGVVSETCALSPKTVAGIRRHATREIPQLHVRTGRDGRVRPLDPIPGRQRIANAIRDDPSASLQKIAVQTGTSVGTVRDVRRRLADGKDPLPEGRRRYTEDADPDHGEWPTSFRWADDTACGSTEDRSEFARWFDATRIRPEDCERYVSVPPLSRLYSIVAEAKSRAQAWAEFAAVLENRARREASTRAVDNVGARGRDR